jgi:hypothetical protein
MGLSTGDLVVGTIGAPTARSLLPNRTLLR